MEAGYDNSFFWENLIIKNEPMWKDAFNNLELTRKSKFIRTSIINYDKNILEDNWAYYPNSKSLLGFIQYVFIPTAFFTLLNNQYEEIIMPVAPTYDIVEYFKDFMDKKDELILFIMKENLQELNTFWKLNEQELLKALKNFSKKFNEKWKEKNGKMLSLNIFENVIKVGEYIMPKEGKDVFTEVLEEEIGMTKNQWEDVYMNVYDNEFIRKKFIDILNYRIEN